MRIHILRMSVTQMASFPALIPAEAPVGFLRTAETYAEVFEGAPLSGGGTGWQKPWPVERGQRFWERYLEKPSLQDVSGRKTWRKLVPLHRKPLARVAITSPLPGSTAAGVELEGFVYPHALAVICTTTLYFDGLPLAGAVDGLVEVRRRSRYAVDWPDQSKTDSLSLDGLLEAALEQIQSLALGSERPEQPLTRKQPFTVTSVLKATLDDRENRSVRPGGEAHRALHAMCDPQAGWRDRSLTARDWDRYAIPVRGRHQVMYARERGRAIWFPEQFGERRSK